jgi:hypothetical protein
MGAELSAEIEMGGRHDEPLSKKYQSSVGYILLTDNYVLFALFTCRSVRPPELTFSKIFSWHAHRNSRITTWSYGSANGISCLTVTALPY